MGYDEKEYEADDVLNELEEESDAIEAESAYINEVSAMAVKRIEEANLFKLLIKEPVFSKNSASPEILESVNRKIRQFAIKELEELLGLSPKKEVLSPKKEVFAEDEVSALKILASKVLKREDRSQLAQEERVPELIKVNSKQDSRKVEQVFFEPTLNSVSPPKNQFKESFNKDSKHVKQEVRDNQNKQPKPGRPAKQQKKEEPQAALDKNKTAKPVGIKPIPMPSAQQLLQVIGSPSINFTEDSLDKGAVNRNSQFGINDIVNSLTGGHKLYVDNSDPAADADGVDVNSRL